MTGSNPDGRIGELVIYEMIKRIEGIRVKAMIDDGLIEIDNQISGKVYIMYIQDHHTQAILRKKKRLIHPTNPP